jgi:hypothetical protein
VDLTLSKHLSKPPTDRLGDANDLDRINAKVNRENWFFVRGENRNCTVRQTQKGGPLVSSRGLSAGL